jgi:hypothetical protein
MKWLQHLEFENLIAQEAFDEYVIQLNEANAVLNVTMNESRSGQNSLAMQKRFQSLPVSVGLKRMSH